VKLQGSAFRPSSEKMKVRPIINQKPKQNAVKDYPKSRTEIQVLCLSIRQVGGFKGESRDRGGGSRAQE
jgi:hypothetical protein